MKLCISAGEERYSALLYDADNNVQCYVHDSPYPVDEQLQSDKLESVVRLHTPFTLVPTEALKTSDIHSIAKEAFTFESVEHVETFAFSELTGLYIVDPALKSAIIRQLPNFHVEHVVETLLARLPKQDCVLSHWYDNNVFILGWRDGLKLANRYTIETPEDAVYYLLSAYQHIGLDPLKDPLHISGHLNKESLIVNKLTGFIKDFVWMTGDYENTNTGPFEPHHFFHLLS